MVSTPTRCFVASGRSRPSGPSFSFARFCHSLSEAQSCGLVHRDIKPANIFLCRYGEDYDFVKVLDFGIVGSTRDPADTSPALTHENAVQGTPAFIAPEQAMGTSVDGRADIYAVGLCRVLAPDRAVRVPGRTPWGFSCSMPRPPPTPPSARTDLPIPRHSMTSSCPCLAKDPADRPQSARELSLSGWAERLEGASGWTQERAREWWATHQL